MSSRPSGVIAIPSGLFMEPELNITQVAATAAVFQHRAYTQSSTNMCPSAFTQMLVGPLQHNLELIKSPGGHCHRHQIF